MRSIGEFCAQRGIPEAFRMQGWVWAASNPAQVGSWDSTVDLLDQFGAHPYRELTTARPPSSPAPTST